MPHTNSTGPHWMSWKLDFFYTHPIASCPGDAELNYRIYNTRKAVHDNTAVEKRNKIFPTIPSTCCSPAMLCCTGRVGGQFVQRRLQCQVAQHRKGASQNQRSPTTCLGTGGTNHLRNH